MTKYVKAFSLNPEPPLELPEPDTIAICCKCKGEIYDGEIYAESADGCVCRDCVDDMWRELTLLEKIYLLGMEPK